MKNICNYLIYSLKELYYNYINYNMNRCPECKRVVKDTGHCECWYYSWRD